MRRRVRIRTVPVVVTAVALALGSPAWAARPLETEDAFTLERGEVEIEAGADYIRESASAFSVPGLLHFNIGVLTGVELGFAAQLAAVHPAEGPSRAGAADSHAQVKASLVTETPVVPAVTGVVILRLPTGDADRELGERGVDVSALVIAAKTIGDVTLNVNAGYTFVTRDRALDLVNAAASVEVPLGKRWTAVGEVVGELATTRAEIDRVRIRAGAVLALGERLRLDAAAGAGVTRASPEMVITLGLTLLLNPR